MDGMAFKRLGASGGLDTLPAREAKLHTWTPCTSYNLRLLADKDATRFGTGHVSASWAEDMSDIC